MITLDVALDKIAELKKENEELKDKNKKMIDEFIELRAKLAEAEKERDKEKRMMLANMSICDKLERECNAERAHNAVLRGALEEAKWLWNLGIDYGYSQARGLENKQALTDGSELLDGICKALSATTSYSAAKVHKLIDALESILNDGWCDETPAKKTARQALVKWRE